MGRAPRRGAFKLEEEEEEEEEEEALWLVSRLEEEEPLWLASRLEEEEENEKVLWLAL